MKTRQLGEATRAFRTVRPRVVRWGGSGTSGPAPDGGRRAGRAARWLAVVGCLALTAGVAEAATAPVIEAIRLENGSLVVSAGVPVGYRHAVLESGPDQSVSHYPATQRPEHVRIAFFRPA